LLLALKISSSSSFFFASRSPLTRTDTTDTEMAEEIAFTAIK